MTCTRGSTGLIDSNNISSKLKCIYNMRNNISKQTSLSVETLQIWSIYRNPFTGHNQYVFTQTDLQMVFDIRRGVNSWKWDATVSLTVSTQVSWTLLPLVPWTTRHRDLVQCIYSKHSNNSEHNLIYVSEYFLISASFMQIYIQSNRFL